MTDRRDHHSALPPDVEQALVDALAPADFAPARSAAVKTRLMARVRAAGQQALRTIQADEGKWKPFLPRVDIKVLRKSEGSLSYLLKLDPGAILLPHDHPMDEECMVLDGEVRIGDVVARAGAYHFAPKGLAHDPIVSDTGALLFLRGAVPSPSQVKWSRMGAFAAAKLAPLRRFLGERQRPPG